MVTEHREIAGFVADELGVCTSTLGPESTLYGDLGLFGDECDDFFTNFSVRFAVSLEGFTVTEFFPLEPHLGPRLLQVMFRRLFLSRDPHEVAQVTPLRLVDLTEWAKTGRCPAPDVTE